MYGRVCSISAKIRPMRLSSTIAMMSVKLKIESRINTALTQSS